jgi:hypothetical protein
LISANKDENSSCELNRMPKKINNHNEMKNIAIGVDIGGSHITCQLYNLPNNQLVPGTKVRKQVNSHASATEILDSWAGAIRETALSQSWKNWQG